MLDNQTVFDFLLSFVKSKHLHNVFAVIGEELEKNELVNTSFKFDLYCLHFYSFDPSQMTFGLAIICLHRQSESSPALALYADILQPAIPATHPKALRGLGKAPI